MRKFIPKLGEFKKRRRHRQSENHSLQLFSQIIKIILQLREFLLDFSAHFLITEPIEGSKFGGDRFCLDSALTPPPGAYSGGEGLWGQSPPWTCVINRFQGVFRPQRVLSPPPVERKKMQGPTGQIPEYAPDPPNTLLM